MARVPYNSEEFISLMQNAYAAFERMTKAFGDIREYVKNAQQSEQNAQQAAQDAGYGAESASQDRAAAEAAAEIAERSAEAARQYSGKPPIPEDGTWHVWDADAQEYTDTGQRSVLTFDVVYDSYAAMVADKDAQSQGTIAIISTDIEEPENARIYAREDTALDGWKYLSDLSGMTGPPGPEGPKGADGAQGPPGEKGGLNVTWGTEELDPGVSPLEAGSVYICYE